MFSLLDSASDDGSCRECPEMPQSGLESAICAETATELLEV
jgi:hypothetical protein